MAYELPVLRNAAGNTIRIAHPMIPASPVTYLAASAAAADTAVTVLDNNGFANNDYAVIGSFGADKTEIKKIGAAVTAGTTLTFAALTYAHAVDSPVAFIGWNRVEISGATTATGSKTVITTMDIQADRPETVYVNTGTTYAFYFARYNNAQTATFSAYSDPMPTAGAATSTIRSVKDAALNMVSEKISSLITDEFLNKEIFNCEQEVWSSKKKWSWAYEFNYIAGDTVTGAWAVALPSDMADSQSNKSLISVRISDRAKLEYLTKEEWDRRYIGVAHTTLATTFSTSATSMVLTDSSDFDETGSVLIGATTYTVTANAQSTGTLTISAASAGQTAGVDVWQGASFGEPSGYTVFDGFLYFDRPISSGFAERNIHLDYYRKPTAIDTDNDALNIPDFTVYHYYLAWKVLLRRNSGISDRATETMRQLFEQRKDTLMRQDRLGQRTTFRPRLNTIRYRDGIQIIATNPQP